MSNLRTLTKYEIEAKTLFYSAVLIRPRFRRQKTLDINFLWKKTIYLHRYFT